MGLDRIGTGPFSILEVYEPDYASFGPVQVHGLPEPIDVGYGDETSFRCACCGSKLSWRCLIQNTEGLAYIVGMKCAVNAQSGIDERKINVLKAKAQRRQVDAALTDDAFVTWLRAQPHPKGWGGRSRYEDVSYWCRKRTPKMSVLNAAKKDFAAGVDGVAALRNEFVVLMADNEAKLRGLPHPSRKFADSKSLYEYAEWVLANRGDTAPGLQGGVNLLTGKLAGSKLAQLREIYETGKKAEADAYIANLATKFREADASGSFSSEDLKRWLGDFDSRESDLRWAACFSVLYGVLADQIKPKNASFELYCKARLGTDRWYYKLSSHRDDWVATLTALGCEDPEALMAHMDEYDNEK